MDNSPRVWQYVRMANVTVRTTVELPPGLNEAMRRYAYEQRLTQRQVVEAALRKYLPAAILKAAKA